MNLLGPCLNPAQPKVQLLGVADPRLLRPIAETLRALGVERGLVVHGSGLDEMAIHGFTQAVRLTAASSRSSRSRPRRRGSPPAAGSDHRRLSGAKRAQAPRSAGRTRRRGRRDDRRAERRSASDDGRKSARSAPRDGDGAGRGSLRQRGRGTQPLHRGEPWLSRSEFSAGSPPARATSSRPLPRRFARRLAGKRTPRRAVSSTRWRSWAQGSSLRSRRLRLPRGRSRHRRCGDDCVRLRRRCRCAERAHRRALTSAARSTISRRARRVRRTDPCQGLLHRSAAGHRGPDRRCRRRSRHAVLAGRRRARAMIEEARRFGMDVLVEVHDEARDAARAGARSAADRHQ